MWLMRRWPLLLTALLLVTGCASSQNAYQKPGTSEGDRKRDTAECARASIGHEPGRHVVTPVVIDREAFAKCLEARGYARIP